MRIITIVSVPRCLLSHALLLIWIHHLQWFKDSKMLPIDMLIGMVSHGCDWFIFVRFDIEPFSELSDWISPLMAVAIEFHLHIDTFDACQNCSSASNVRRLHLNSKAFRDIIGIRFWAMQHSGWTMTLKNLMYLAFYEMARNLCWK